MKKNDFFILLLIGLALLFHTRDEQQQKDLFWALLGWPSVSVTSAALRLVLIASEIITPVSVKQCCQTPLAQQCFHSILCTPADQMEASQADERFAADSCEDYEVAFFTLRVSLSAQSKLSLTLN